MPRASVIARNEKRKILVKKNLTKRYALKQRIIRPASAEDQQEALVALQKMPRDSSPIRVRNRCNVTGRPRGVYKKRFGLTRHAIRLLMRLGQVPGLTKSSW